MSNYINNINTYADLTAYNADTTKDYPNVSYIKATDEVKMYEYDPEYIVAKYNVTSTSSATNLLSSKINITKQYIDGVEQQSVQTDYTFDTTGEHIVKFLTNRNKIGGTLNFAFTSSTSLISITIPDTIINIDGSSFQSCTGLTSINIPNSVTTIGASAFVGAGFTNVTLPDSVTSLGNQCFRVCQNITNATLGNGITTIPLQTFKDCPNLVNVTIGNRVTSIEESAFNGCSSLTNINIPNTLTTIGASAFVGAGFTNVTLPSNITSIGNQAFNYCRSLASVTVLATTPPTLGTNVFDNNASGRKIYVPSASVTAYKAASGWSTYASYIEAIPNS